MTTILVAEHTIPGTKSTVKIELTPGSGATLLNGKMRDQYTVTRQDGPGFNYISCGRQTEAEARQAANDLWTYARDRAAAKAAQPAPLGEPTRTAPAKLTPGVYRASATGEGQEGELYKVYKARGHDGMLAKRVVVGEGWEPGDPDRVAFEYAGAARRFVDPSTKLTLEEAKAFGKTHGYCCNCGALLTDPESIAAGIGPICAGKF